MRDSQYIEWRSEIEARFSSMRPVPEPTEVHTSPSGEYSLEVIEYTSAPESWNYTRGVVRHRETQEVIADIRRNYGIFWHAWVQQKDRQFLLCGEDYQGYNVIDLSTGTNTFTFPLEAYKGTGFCWAAVHPSPSGELLAVEGCYWACPYEIVIYDFKNPSLSPLPELFRAEDLDQVLGWQPNEELQYTVGDGKKTEVWRRL
jgi:hypothetical protein